jgi:protein-S-isoprenylcysteine O-methyltransferase Ste14
MNAIKTTFAAILVPGVICLLIPIWIATSTMDLAARGFGVLQVLAIPIVLYGIYLVVAVCVAFVREGHGTPIPIDPPKEFVRTGWYRYVRNPMYLGAVLIFTGDVVYTGSVWIFLFGLFMFLMLHTFVVVFEEPQLVRRFGQSYSDYMKEVPRWLPRFPKNPA